VSAALATTKLPGIFDFLAHEKTQRVELARVVGEHNAVHTENHAALESTVSDHKAAGDKALAEAYELLWKYFARQTWQLTQDNSAQKNDFNMSSKIRKALPGRGYWPGFVNNPSLSWRGFPFVLPRLHPPKRTTAYAALR
jgi:hypothetical protein